VKSRFFNNYRFRPFPKSGAYLSLLMFNPRKDRIHLVEGGPDLCVFVCVVPVALEKHFPVSSNQ
jgi:hypothetical protein